MAATNHLLSSMFGSRRRPGPQRFTGRRTCNSASLSRSGPPIFDLASVRRPTRFSIVAKPNRARCRVPLGSRLMLIQCHPLLAHSTSDDVARARPDIGKRLRRFPLRHRPAVKAVAERHLRVAELAISFPALLFALAVPRSGFEPTPIIGAIIAGAPLRDLALQVGLPMWSRKLMPEAFERPLDALPNGDVVARQIANHLPRSPKLAPRWLRAVCYV
jgi:hypothetical protein